MLERAINDGAGELLLSLRDGWRQEQRCGDDGDARLLYGRRCLHFGMNNVVFVMFVTTFAVRTISAC